MLWTRIRAAKTAPISRSARSCYVATLTILTYRLLHPFSEPMRFTCGTEHKLLRLFNVNRDVKLDKLLVGYG